MSVEKIKVDRDGLHFYAGLSTDTKPSGVPAGSSFWETDTGQVLYRHADGWADRRVSVLFDDTGFQVMYLFRFNAVADMPVDITSAANVSADRFSIASIDPGAYRAVVAWHGAGIAGPDTQGTQAFFGEVAMGALVTFNADDDVDADARLTYTDQTGGSVVSAGVDSLVMVSKSRPVVDRTLGPITRIDGIGVPNGLSTTHLDLILPCFLSVEIFYR